jgi:hypothetical protein
LLPPLVARQATFPERERERRRQSVTCLLTYCSLLPSSALRRRKKKIVKSLAELRWRRRRRRRKKALSLSLSSSCAK